MEDVLENLVWPVHGIFVNARVVEGRNIGEWASEIGPVLGIYQLRL